MTLFQKHEFWQALAAMSWPLVVLIIFLMARDRIFSFFSRDGLTIKIAGMEVSVADATKRVGEQLADLEKKVAQLASSQVPGPVPEPKEPQQEVDESDRLTVLWVDDVPSNNAFLIDKMMKEGIDVDLSVTTEDAMNKIRTKKYNLVISDFGRREVGVSIAHAGLRLTEQIRREGWSMPVLIFAGARGLSNRDKLLAAGATEVTASSGDLLRFVDAVRQGS
jgi:CheY-like chemotaxis protein